MEEWYGGRYRWRWQGRAEPPQANHTQRSNGLAQSNNVRTRGRQRQRPSLSACDCFAALLVADPVANVLHTHPSLYELHLALAAARHRLLDEDSCSRWSPKPSSVFLLSSLTSVW